MTTRGKIAVLWCVWIPFIGCSHQHGPNLRDLAADDQDVAMDCDNALDALTAKWENLNAHPLLRLSERVAALKKSQSVYYRCVAVLRKKSGDLKAILDNPENTLDLRQENDRTVTEMNAVTHAMRIDSLMIEHCQTYDSMCPWPQDTKPPTTTPAPSRPR